jgi:hypothetical protein
MPPLFDPHVFETIGPGSQTVNDLLTHVLQDLMLVPGGGALPDPDDMQVALDRLNDWIDALALEGLTIPTITRATWTLTAGTASYTVGAGQVVNISKPVNPQAISNIGYYDSSLSTITEILFGAVLTEEQYQSVPQKALQQNTPTAFYYDPTFGTTGTLKPIPIPNISTLVGVIYAPSLLTEVTLASVIALPRGYRRFFRTNLAVEVASAFEVTPPAAIVKAAAESSMRVKASNLRMVDLGMDSRLPGLRGRGYNILTDT